MPGHSMYKMIACDLDETLIGSDRRISPRNRDAIRQALELGIKFVPTTGRGYASVQGILREIGLYDEKDQYVVSYNGGAITENCGNKLLYFNGLTFEQAELLFQRGMLYDVCIHVYTLETVYVYNFVPNEQAYLRGRMEVDVLKEPSIDFLRERPIGKILFNSINMDYLHQIESDLYELTKGLEIYYSSARYLEFNPQGVSKGSGLLRLADLLGVRREDIIAIGDNFNDRSMIRAAGLGVGVRNAVEEIKPDCDYITNAAYDQDAVAEVIERFVL